VKRPVERPDKQASESTAEKTSRKMASFIDIHPDLISTDAARDPLRPPGPRRPDKGDAVPGNTAPGRTALDKTVRGIARAAPIERP
jgi:hypothetical protein